MINKECPLCEGEGILIDKLHTDKFLKVKYLKARGLSLRQIAKVMNFKSHSVVTYYLNRYK